MKEKRDGYSTWMSMKQRCYNPNSTIFQYYGGAGVRVCEAWRTSFDQFFLDMGPRPDGYHIHRVNRYGDYSPENCIWIDPQEHRKIHGGRSRALVPHRERPRQPQKTTNRKPTARQLEVLAFIASCELSPTIREIGVHFGISVKGAYDHVIALQRKGKISMHRNKSRSIAVIA